MWKLEQYQARNKEITAFWNLAIIWSDDQIGDKTVVDNSPFILYIKFKYFDIFFNFLQVHLF